LVANIWTWIPPGFHFKIYFRLELTLCGLGVLSPTHAHALVVASRVKFTKLRSEIGSRPSLLTDECGIQSGESREHLLETQSPETSSEPPVAHSDHQAVGDEPPVSLTPPEHQPDIVRSPVCPTEHQQDVYDPPVALPKQERDAGEPPVALPPGEQDASEPTMALQEHVHDAGEPPMTLPEYVPGVGEAFPVAWPAVYQENASPLLAEPLLDVTGLDCESLGTHALQRAYAGYFPAEAMKTNALGCYAQYLKPYLEQMPGWNAIGAVSANRTERNFPARMAYDANMLERLMNVRPQDLPADLQKSEGWLHAALTQCMSNLPDFDYSGWVKMPWQVFEKDPRLKGNPSIFLHHLFNKHAGEVIFVQRLEVGVVARPWNVNVHHPQFYMDAHINAVSKDEAELAAGFFWAKKKGNRQAPPVARSCGS
jgi:hypothetical protein